MTLMAASCINYVHISLSPVLKKKLLKLMCNVLKRSLSICFSFLHLLLGGWALPRLPCIFDFQCVLQREAQMETWRAGRENAPEIHRYLWGHVWAVAVFFYQTPQLLLNGPSPKSTALSRAGSHSALTPSDWEVGWVFHHVHVHPAHGAIPSCFSKPYLTAV